MCVHSREPLRHVEAIASMFAVYIMFGSCNFIDVKGRSCVHFFLHPGVTMCHVVSCTFCIRFTFIDFLCALIARDHLQV